ncbi:G-type lectin S-receptor-like serine/threonine-protein kinase RKS1 [Jatropha curcas]|uniref:G-type lectin S-receptor-like serine/threonine-protein kinase RKS1 n=1 Tax=Jatropha curcas TaxID=180498 RepID=UPI0009D71464|nr:G-type lectin S-receptor-like serine/threonine-protein kinase RKS1 [Jatropha curcas]
MDSHQLFLFAFLLILHFTFCFSRDIIAINQIFKDGNLLISKEENFALGFFSPGNSTYRYLGIWFHKVREQTVVWVANRNHPINGSSGVLSINQYGNLILYSDNNQKVPVWSTNVSMEVTDTCLPQLLDSGNLILVQDRSKRVVWQSFDYPTDTHLPGMRIGLNQKTGFQQFLTSWRSPDDPATGDYSLQLIAKGSPQFVLYKGANPQWRSAPWPIKNFVDFRNFTFVNREDQKFVTYLLIDTSIIFKIMLEYSGIFKQQIWHESEGKWKDLRSVPKHVCDPYGHCGINSRCDPQQINRGFECDCLPGYKPKSPRDWNILKDGSGGCVRKRLQSSSMCMHVEGFVQVAHVKLPDTSGAVWVGMNTSPMDCEKECKSNCSCSAFASIDLPGRGTGCLAWFGELIDSVDSMDEGYDIYVRVDAIELAISQKSQGFLQRKDMLAILVVSVVSAWFIIILFSYLWLKKKRTRVTKKWNRKLLDIGTLVANEVGGSTSHPEIVFFNLSSIIAATKNFSPANIIGQGGFGFVYKGQLSNGQEVAVKRLSKNSTQGIEEFKNEVILIAKLQHKNLVKLLGCCIQGEDPILIYEYLPNKSLDSFLFDETRRSILDWRTRFDIIVGIARGILYIHQDSRLRIIHRDLKTSNILLDAEMNPKISDFGLARIFKGDQIQQKTKKIAGTFGYMSPEYVLFGKFSTKSDVFSFGVILLEIITGKKNNDFVGKDYCLSLLGHIWHSWREDRQLEIIDSSLKESYPPLKASRCIQIGLLCVQKNVMDRPTMSTVVLWLNSEINLPPPKEPSFIFREFADKSNSFVTGGGFCSANEVTITDVVSR